MLLLSTRILRLLLVIVLGFAACTLCGGCTAAGAAAYVLTGPPSVPAKYTLEKKPTLVLVENYRHPTAAANDAQQLTRYLNDEFHVHELAPVIDEMELYQLRSSEADNYRKMTIPAIGKAVGAEQVLYVDLTGVSIRSPQTGNMLKGEISVRVRVVDVASGETLWPTGTSEGAPMSYETPMLSLNEPTDVHAVRQKLHRQMAAAIGRLFYTYKPDEIDTRS